MRTTCIFTGCEQPFHAKRLCKRHYQQQWTTGSPEIKRPNPRGTMLERFWRHVQRRGEEECWLWTGFLDKDGYGKLRIGNTNIGAHRFSYITFVGPVPEGVILRHKCNTPACANPNHVIPGTHLENMSDRLEAGNYPTNELHPMARISDRDVAAIRASWGTHKALALRFGISVSQIGNIRRGDQRKGIEPSFDLIPEEVA